MTSLETLRCLISQRLCVAAEEIFMMVERILTEYQDIQTLCNNKQQPIQPPPPRPHTADLTPRPACAEGSTEQRKTMMSSSPVKEEPEELPQRPEEEPELPQRPEEAEEWSALTLPLESGDDENEGTEPLAGTSTDHMKTQAYIEYWVPPQPTSEELCKELLSSHSSASDTEDSDDWDETREGRAALKTRKPRKRRRRVAEGQISSPRNELSQDLTSSKQTGGKRFSCVVCGRSFRNDPCLKAHMKTHVEGEPFTHLLEENPSRCVVCGKSFSCSSYLKNHMRIHTGEKPFTCPICERSFTQKGTLNKHVRTHTGGKPFNCNVCEKTFRESVHLKMHMMTHSGVANPLAIMQILNT